MAILSGPEIRRQMVLGAIVIRPCDLNHIGTNSVDLHLGDTLLRYALPHRHSDAIRSMRHPIDSRRPPSTVEVPLDDGWVLHPGVLYLAATREWTETRGFVPSVHGRSSFGRLGLFCHVTAGLGDNGFMGNWTLELVTVEPLVIYPGQRIAQLTFQTIDGMQVEYGNTGNTSGRYQGDRGPTPIRLDTEDRLP